MLLQTNSYIVPKDKRTQHARLVQRFRQTLTRLGCDHFEAYEQVGANWSPADTTGRFVQLMRFRDRKHQLAVQAAERDDATAQGLIKEFCELINFPYQQQQGLFAVGFYHSLLPTLGRMTMETASGAGSESSSEAEEELPAETEEPTQPVSVRNDLASSPEPGQPVSGSAPQSLMAAEPESDDMSDFLDSLGSEETTVDAPNDLLEVLDAEPAVDPDTTPPDHLAAEEHH